MVKNTTFIRSCADGLAQAQQNSFSETMGPHGHFCALILLFHIEESAAGTDEHTLIWMRLCLLTLIYTNTETKNVFDEIEQGFDNMIKSPSEHIALLLFVVCGICATVFCMVTTCYVSVLIAINKSSRKKVEDKVGGADHELLSILDFHSVPSVQQINDIDDDESVDADIRLID